MRDSLIGDQRYAGSMEWASPAWVQNDLMTNIAKSVQQQFGD